MRQGVMRADDMRRENRHRVLRDVRHAGRATQGEIAGRTGLSAATVSSIATELADNGILKKELHTSAPPSTRGRPKHAVSLNAEAATVALVIIQAERIVTAQTRFDGTIIGRQQTQAPVATMTPEALADTVVSQLKSHMALQTVRHITIGFQGVTDRAQRRVLWSPVTSFRDAPLADLIEQKSGTSACVRNDSDVVTLALLNGADHGLGRDFCTILLSQGVGMGLVLDGQIMSGIQSSAIEFGHMVFQSDGAPCRCGRNGCIEAYAGGYAIKQQAFGNQPFRTPDDPVTPEDMRCIADAATTGDQPALAAATTAGKALGVGLANIFCLFDPVPVALVGRGTWLMAQMEPAIRQALADHAAPEIAEQMRFHVEHDALPLLIRGCACDALERLDERFADLESVQPMHRTVEETVGHA